MEVLTSHLPSSHPPPVPHDALHHDGNDDDDDNDDNEDAACAV